VIIALRAVGFEKPGAILTAIIAKRLDAPYASGERTAAVKVKQIRTVDCVVGGFRYATGARVIVLFCSDFTATTDCCITSDSSPGSKHWNGAR